MDSRKIQRINSDILRVLAVAINQKLHNPEIVGVDVLNVDTAPNLASAKVFVSIMGDEHSQQKVLSALEKSSGFLQSEIATNIKIRQVPKLKFILDKGRKNFERVEQLLARINNEH